MATLTVSFDGDGIARMSGALNALAGARKEAALRRALNHTGDKAYTLVRRTLTKQMGLPNQRLFKDGRTLVKRRAMGASFEFQIVSHGRAVRAKEFRHHVGKRGITFYPWGVKHHFKSAFVIPAFSGNFYRRRGKARFPVEALYGPNLNKELVKDATAAAFFHIANTSLAARVGHEIRAITNGVLT